MQLGLSGVTAQSTVMGALLNPTACGPVIARVGTVDDAALDTEGAPQLGLVGSKSQ